MENKELKELFLKDKYYAFKNNKFNIWALMGGYLYLFYRKLYGIGTIIMVIDILLYYFNLYWLILIFNLLLGAVFNRLYLRFVDKKIIDYKLNYMDYEEVVKACKRKNISWIGLTIVSFVSLIIIVISYIDFDVYKVKMGDLSLKLENTWKIDDYNNEYYVSYGYQDDDNNCSLTIEKIGLGNGDEFIDNILISYGKTSEVEEIVINGVSYKTTVIENNGFYNYIYVTDYHNTLYAILFDIYYDDGVCDNFRKEIIDSVRLKN